MKVSIITIGDELLIGQVVDSNSAYIGRELSGIGAVISGKFTVGDDAAQITSALHTATTISDAVIITGGLGPTKDDITKTTLAEYFSMPLKENPEVLQDIREMLSRRGVEVNGLNRAQAMVPDGCTVLRNPNGTAPGMWFEMEGKIVVSLPGVPFEMEFLMQSEVLPRLQDRFERGTAVHRTVHTAGIAESLLAEKIAGWENSLPDGIKLAYLPSTAGVRLRLSSYHMPGAEARKIIDQEIEALKTIVGPYLLAGDDSDPAAAIGRLLTDGKRTIAVAESCTGGKIAEMITRRPGASAYFKGGVVAYTEEIKTTVLGVPAGIIEKHGVVSGETAMAMAGGVRTLMNSDYAVSTTGIAGPHNGDTGIPVGTVWIGIAHPGGCYARKMVFGKLRGPNIERASHTALNLLRLYLEGTPDTPVAGGIF